MDFPLTTPREGLTKGGFMPNLSTCDTCESVAIRTYSNGDGSVEKVCGYHNYLLTKVAEFCITCDQQRYVGSCFCDN